MHSKFMKRFTKGTRIAYDVGFVNNRGQILQAVLAARRNVCNHITQEVMRKNSGSNTALALHKRLRLLGNTSHGARIPLKIPANAARRPSDLGASENVHLATDFVLNLRRLSLSE